VRALAKTFAGALVLAAVVITGGCQKIFGDYSVSESSITSACTAGAVQCYGNALQRCNATGTAWANNDTCASDALCDAGRGMCLPPACSAGERRCNGAQLEGCNSDRNGWLLLAPCPSAGHCSTVSGSCTAEPCQTGKTQCSGSTFQACNESRTGWVDVDTCASSELCNPVAGCGDSVCFEGQVRCEGAELQTCNPGKNGWTTIKSCDSAALCDEDAKTCLEVACTTPGAYRCSDAGALERCADDLTAWLAVEACESAAHCDALNGKCNTAPCEPGDHQCNGAVLQVCNATSSGWNTVETCLSDGLCQQSLSSGENKCRSPACTGGSFQCQGAQPLVCNAALTEFRPNGAPCMTAELCNAASGTCGVPVCAPGQTRCTGAQPEICNPGRTMFVPHGEACASAALCRPETGTCGDVVCLSGQKRCDPESPTALQVCNATFDGWDACDTCATPELCSASLSAVTCGASACVEPTCSPGDRWCGGNNNRSLQQCPPSRINTQPVTIDTCETNGLCELTRADPTRTECVAKSCNLPDRWCGGTGNRTLYKCPPSLINSQPVLLDTCETNGLCEQAHDEPDATMCPDPVCAAGAKSCDGATLRICNAARTGFDTRACGSATLCMSSLTPASQTTCDACVAGTFRCNAAQPQQCNKPANGPAAWTNLGSPCGAGETCDAATGECLPPIGNGGAGGGGSGGAGGDADD